ncbi:DUF3530 family protein [Reinekea marinisedimentorum]|uniref:Uncharacterized protein DUF3530 n=1 Tax=Reinekea marinisedimentorum TaxID=230495 RepID=A0A4R3I466_9GAMM|nr:DUF3530 family protein [Reinekea marinisedimentorum]TCS40380.1 uncharacterized protein DUF3530 [Reinekea marinisedimentorum]
MTACTGLLALCLLPVYAATLPTPSATLQQNLAQHYQQALTPLEVVQLNAENEPFLGLFYDQLTASPQGAVLILHDAGTSPDWPYLQRQLHRYLPEVGWSTLAISLPPPQAALNEVRSEQSITYTPQSPEQWQARMNNHIAAALAELNERGFFNIAVIGIGDSAYQAARYLSERLNPLEQDGYALIMINAPSTYPDLPAIVGALSISTLDLYMTEGRLAHQQADLRKAAAAKQQHPDYLLINDAPRQGFYSIPDIDRTTRRVWGWLRNHAAGLEAQLADKRR